MGKNKNVKVYSYLTDDGNIDKKAKGSEKCLIKQGIKFKDCKTCLENNKTILRNQQKLNIIIEEKI